MRLVLVTGVTHQTNDKQSVEPMRDALARWPEFMDRVESAAMDNGYFSAANVQVCVEKGIEPLIALGREAHPRPLDQRFGPDASEPDSDDLIVKDAWRLKTKAGRALDAKRTATVEPVFGIIEPVMGFRQLSLRGFAAGTGEGTLVTLTFNLRRMHVLHLT